MQAYNIQKCMLKIQKCKFKKIQKCKLKKIQDNICYIVCTHACGMQTKQSADYFQTLKNIVLFLILFNIVLFVSHAEF